MAEGEGIEEQDDEFTYLDLPSNAQGRWRDDVPRLLGGVSRHLATHFKDLLGNYILSLFLLAICDYPGLGRTRTNAL